MLTISALLLATGAGLVTRVDSLTACGILRELATYREYNNSMRAIAKCKVTATNR